MLALLIVCLGMCVTCFTPSVHDVEHAVLHALCLCVSICVLCKYMYVYGTCHKLLVLFHRNPHFAIMEFCECSQNFPQSVRTCSADWLEECTNCGTWNTAISRSWRDLVKVV